MTKTPYLGLDKPYHNEQDWDVIINSNFDILDEESNSSMKVQVQNINSDLNSYVRVHQGWYEVNGVKALFNGAQNVRHSDWDTDGTYYIYLTSSGTLVLNGTTYDTGLVQIQLARVVCVAGKITNLYDDRIVLTAGSLSSSSNSVLFSCPSTVSIGDLVYISGIDTVDKASNSSGATVPCVGFVSDKPTTTTCLVVRNGIITTLSGLIPGNEYFLGINGGVTHTSPISAGSIVQRVGVAKNTTTLITAIDFDYVVNV